MRSSAQSVATRMVVERARLHLQFVREERVVRIEIRQVHPVRFLGAPIPSRRRSGICLADVSDALVGVAGEQLLRAVG